MLTECSNKGVVEIKGVGGSLGLILHQSSSFEQIEHELEYLLNERGKLDFFRGSNIVLRAGKRVLSDGEFHRLQELLLNEGDLALQLPSPPRIPEFTKGNTSFFNTPLSELAVAPIQVIKASSVPENNPSPILDEPKMAFPKQVLNSVPVLPSSPSFPTPVHFKKAEQPQTSEEKSLNAKEVAEYKEVKTVKPKEPFTSEPEPQPEQDLFAGIDTEEALVIRQTLRSGQKISSSKSVIVFGDLNSGAEIISDQNVVILGVIRGTVHAGANGNPEAKILGLRMLPTQIRIDTFISQPPQEENPNSIIVGPERAFVEDGQIVVENNAYNSEQLLPLLSEKHRSKRKIASLRVPSISVGAVRL